VWDRQVAKAWASSSVPLTIKARAIFIISLM
jgi:hypothetical protein